MFVRGDILQQQTTIIILKKYPKLEWGQRELVPPLLSLLCKLFFNIAFEVQHYKKLKL